MKMAEAQQLYQEGKLVRAELMRNPMNLNEWFVMLHKNSKKSFILVDENNETIVDADLKRLLAMLKSMGFKQTVVHL
ncbi:MAG: hypothetical protein H6999_09155 [Hahellaceae bacterium]|nr:hypothetical protein [Hahellaceae bacterium]MCP5169909.1 hypothetical protein [Hahellaceae bacterium]